MCNIFTRTTKSVTIFNDDKALVITTKNLTQYHEKKICIYKYTSNDWPDIIWISLSSSQTSCKCMYTQLRILNFDKCMDMYYVYLGVSLLVRNMCIFTAVSCHTHFAQSTIINPSMFCIQVCITWRQNVREKSYDLARFQIEMQCIRIHNTYVIDFLPRDALLKKPDD